jgi:hypothetical protein
LRHNGLAPSPGSAQKTARRLAGHLLAAVGSQRCSAGWLPTIRRRAASPLPLACCVAGRSFGLASTRPTWGSGHRALDRICRIPSRPTGPSHREVLARLHRQGSTPAAVDFAALRPAERRAGYRAAKAPRAGGPSSSRPGLPQPRSAPRAPCPWPTQSWRRRIGLRQAHVPPWPLASCCFVPRNGWRDCFCKRTFWEANRYEIVVAKKARACAAGPRPPTERPARIEPRPWRWPSAGKGPPGFRARALDTAVARTALVRPLNVWPLNVMALKCYGP